MAVLVTGAAGFIGYHAARALLERGEAVVGVDCLTDYYDVALKQARLAELGRFKGFRFERLDLADAAAVRALVLSVRPRKILHLAAQAGVRYSLENPFAYTHSNISGHLSVLEAARALDGELDHLVYASSSSVYGERPAERGFSEDDAVDAPVSLYAATKRADELMSGTYAHLYGLPLTGLRFFTVYGPWGRPDMAYFSFAEKMIAGQTLKLFNHGRNLRDFTFIGDIIPHLLALVDDRPGPGNRVFNIGGSSPVDTLALVSALEAALGIEARTEKIDAQPGDVSATWADTSRLEAAYGAAPHTALQDGIGAFARWFRGWKGLDAPRAAGQQ
ncbi:MAG: NAD-dependent epimerase/dehydratase family protein [Oceanicaulis sp.]